MDQFKGCQFNKDVIIVAVGYYFRFNLSYRDIVEMLYDRGVSVHHTTIMSWVHHYGPIFQILWRRHKQSASQNLRIDETYIKVKGRWCYQGKNVNGSDKNCTVLPNEYGCHLNPRIIRSFISL